MDDRILIVYCNPFRYDWITIERIISTQFNDDRYTYTFDTYHNNITLIDTITVTVIDTYNHQRKSIKITICTYADISFVLEIYKRIRRIILHCSCASMPDEMTGIANLVADEKFRMYVEQHDIKIQLMYCCLTADRASIVVANRLLYETITKSFSDVTIDSIQYRNIRSWYKDTILSYTFGIVR